MKRKLLILFLSIVSTVCLAVGLTACSGSGGNSGLSSGTEQSGTGGGTEQTGTDSGENESGNTSGGETSGESGGETESSGSGDSSTEGGSTEGGSTEGGSTEGGDTEENPSAHTHTLVHTEKVEATCVKEGNTEYWYCSDCGKYFSDENGTIEIKLADTVIEATGKHVPITTAVTENLVEATCTSDGSYDNVFYCSVCNEKLSSETITIPASHTPAEAVQENVVEATCLVDGSYDSVVYCYVCGKQISRESKTIYALGSHTPAEAVAENIVEGTCGKNGSYESVVYCSICGEEISRETLTITATGNHTYGEDNICTVCGMKKPSEGLKFTLSSDETYYTVSGIGECTDTDIVIPSIYENLPVTAIASSAFNNQTQIISIYVPDSVTSIGSGAFSGCSSLVSITLPFVGGRASATSASASTLFGYIFGTTNYTSCTSTKQYYASGSSYATYYLPTTLTTVTITGGDILYGAFYNCTKLTSVTIPDDVTSIGNYAFYDCNSLTSFTVPDSVNSIGDGAFYNCSSLKNIYYGGSASQWASISFGDTTANPLYYAGSLYLSGTLATEITLKDITAINAYSFYGCTSLTSVTIGDGITSIGEGSFCGCSKLTSVNIPSGVTSIGNSAFYNCSALTKINFNATAMEDLSSSNYVFADAGRSGEGITVTIGANVTSIPAYLFYPYYSSSSYAPNITNIVFEDDSVCESIGDYAFRFCTSLASIDIPDSVTSIGNYAFGSCSSLTSATIPNSIISIGSYAFDYCISLENVYYSGTASQWASISFEDYAANPLCYAGNLYLNGTLATDITIEGTTTINDYAFNYCTSLKSVTISSGVNSISEYAFGNCTSLTNVTIFGNVTSIGSYAFAWCDSLISVTIGNSIASIGECAFYYCTSLTSIVIPDSVISIGDYAFLECSSLTSVYFGGTASKWALITIDSDYSNLTYAALYYYSETQPAESGNYWHYVDDEIVVWTVE